MNKLLLIIQDVPTQFDVPLYNLIAQESPFRLYVMYTQTASSDAELGMRPIWDHIDEHYYAHEHLDDSDRRRAQLVASRVIEQAPDHVVISGYWPKLHRDLLGKLSAAGISVGLRSDNTIQHSNLSGLRAWVKKQYLSRLLSRYSKWHPVGKQATDYLQHLSKVDRPISLFPYNIDRAWFRTQSQKSRAQRKAHLAELGFESSSYVVLAILKWVEREDPMTLLRAFKRFHSANNDAKLVLIGDGPLREEVSVLVNGLADAVRTPGYQSYSKLPHWYGLANVFVHPAPDEPWGVSVNEALASGVPVIASKGVGAALELIDENRNGLLFDQRDEHSLLCALQSWRMIEEAAPTDVADTCYRSLDDWNYRSTIKSFEKVLQDA